MMIEPINCTATTIPSTTIIEQHHRHHHHHRLSIDQLKRSKRSRREVSSIGGNLSIDTQLSIEFSPYQLDQTLIVPYGITLRIDAGVRIELPVDAAVIIYGLNYAYFNINCGY
jgi:hypothetical protein